MIKSSSVFIIIIVLIAWLVYLFPGEAISPGDLLEKHSHLEENCSSCHVTFQGPSGEKCTKCHAPEKIGTLKPGISGTAKKAVTFHREFGPDSCISCHKEHQGRFASSQTVQFSHQMLGLKDMQNCIECHPRPQDSIHQKASQNCAQCHSSSNWGSAEIDHSAYFRFDRDHQANCSTCHPNSNFNEYTCYNCHEHSEQKVSRKHFKEGIRDFNDCAECHRSGDEHDIRRTGKSGRSDVEIIDDDFKSPVIRSKHDRKSKSRSDDDHERDDEHDRRKRDH